MKLKHRTKQYYLGYWEGYKEALGAIECDIFDRKSRVDETIKRLKEELKALKKGGG